MVDSAPGFTRQPEAINGFSDLILNVFSHERGAHARSAVGLAELPLRIPVEIDGEVALSPSSADSHRPGDGARSEVLVVAASNPSG